VTFFGYSNEYQTSLYDCLYGSAMIALQKIPVVYSMCVPIQAIQAHPLSGMIYDDQLTQYNHITFHVVLVNVLQTTKTCGTNLRLLNKPSI